MASTGSDLDAALNEFQQHLSPEQKAEFDSSVHEVPAPSAVLLLTNEISSRSSDRKSHVLAGRMRVVLEAIQQYSAIADTAASIHPVAALVWTCAKTVIQMSLKFAGYFEKLSERFAQLSAYCPRYTAYERLFKQSQRVRDSLENFYAIIVKFCTKALRVIQERGVKRFAKSLWKAFKDDFEQLEENLSAAKQDVDEEIQLASEQKTNTINQQLQVISREVQFQRWQQTVEMQENRAFRSQQSFALAEGAELKKQQIIKGEERKRIRFLNLICSYDHTESQNKASRLRYDGTARWLFKRAEFKEWIEEPKPLCLWCSGNTGCGKTVLAGQAVEQVGKISMGDTNTTIVYYFFTSERKDSLSPHTFIRSCLYQIIRTKELTPFIRESLEKIVVGKSGGQETEIEEIERLLIAICSTIEKIILVIDGMNEAEQPDQRKVLRFLKTLTESTATIKLFITSQPELDLHRIFGEGSVIHVGIKPQDNSTEIEKFVDSRIEKEFRGGALAVCESDIIEDIKRVLKLKAKGMFLWVELQVRAICDVCEEDETSNGVTSMLAKLPEGLAGIYSNALEKILRKDDDQIQNIKKIFQWSYSARRPLTINELHDALTIEPGQELWKEPTKKFRPSTISRLCGNLIIFDDADNTISLAHHTVRAFIESQPATMMAPISFANFISDVRTADNYLADVCITYISFADFQKSLTTRSKPDASSYLSQPLLLTVQGLAGPYATRMPGLRRLVQPFARHSGRHNFDTEAQLKNCQPQRIDSSFELLDYCLACWHHHCWFCLNQPAGFLARSTKTTIANLTTQPSLPFTWHPWNPPDDLDPVPHWQIFLWAVQNHHPCVLLAWNDMSDTRDAFESWKMLLESRTLLENFDTSLRSSTHAQHGFIRAMQHVEISQVLLNYGLIIVTKYNFRFAIDLLLKLGADANFRPPIESKASLNAAPRSSIGHVFGYGTADMSDCEGLTPLQLAALLDRTEIARRLVQEGAHVNDKARQKNDFTALQLAVQGGHLDIVTMLLRNNAEIDSTSTLRLAAYNGHVKMANLLMNRDSIPWNGLRDAIYAAAEMGHSNVISLLLAEFPSHIQLYNEITATALQIAAINGHENVVKFFLARGSISPSDCISSIHAAAEKGRLNLIQFWLRDGFRKAINEFDEVVARALQIAASNGHKDVVEFIQTAGSISPSDRVGAIHAAAENGHLDVIDVILKKSNITFGPSDLQPALKIARQNNHRAVVKKLRWYP